MSATDQAAPLVAADEGWAVPASYAQERILRAPDGPAHVLADRHAVPLDLPAGRMRGVLAALCARHEPLRTSFRADPDGLMQVVHAEVALPVDVVDVSALDGAELDGRLAALLREQAAVPMPVDRAPLWRATLAHLGPGHGWEVLLTLHPAVADATAVEVLREEITALAAGGELPELPIQYADYALWQRDALDRGRADELLGTWREALAGAPAGHGIPTDRPRPAGRLIADAHVVRPLPVGSRDAAAALAGRAAATPLMVMLTAWAAVAHRLSGAEDLVIALPVAGRDRPEVARLVGVFADVLPVRVDVSGRPSFLQLLGRVRSAVLAARAAQDLPSQRLAGTAPAAAPPHRLGFDHAGGGRRPHRPVGADLALEVDGDELRVRYATALFDEATAARVADLFAGTLDSGLSDPDGPVPGAEPGGAHDPTGKAARPAAEDSASTDTDGGTA